MPAAWSSPASSSLRRDRACRSTSCSPTAASRRSPGIDTRALTLLLRNGAARRATIVPAEVGEADAIERARISPTWESVDHVAAVATREPFRTAPVGERRARAVLVDYGVKRSLLAALAGRGIEVVALPPDATAADVAAQAPDLVVLAPGPGDPASNGASDRDGSSAGDDRGRGRDTDPRHLPGPPAARAGRGRRDPASGGRPPRRESRRSRSGHRSGRHRRPQPRGRGGRRAGAGGGRVPRSAIAT